MEEQHKYYIQTDRSALSSYIMDEVQMGLVEQAIDEIDAELIANLPILIYGKECIQRRSIGFFSNESIGYKYSKKLVASKQLTPLLSQLLNQINEKFESDFNGILINKYIDGNDNIGKHSDDESALSNAGVVIISYGAERTFRIRNKNDGAIVNNVKTKANEILIMSGDFQKEFTHEIPVEKKVTETRYSLTFRKHLI